MMLRLSTMYVRMYLSVCGRLFANNKYTNKYNGMPKISVGVVGADVVNIKEC